MCALAAVEINMAELRDLPGWWDFLSAENRHEWLEVLAKVRQYQHEAQGLTVLRPSKN
jgi:hypothetical protein